MKPKNIKTLLALFLLVSFTSCFKKGKDDPFISLRTRKARVVGKWKMVKGIKTIVSFPSNTITTEYTNDEYTLSFSGSTVKEIGNIIYTIEFEKNGKLNEYRQLEYSDRHAMVGSWNFTGNIGSKKNKEEIQLHDTRLTFPSDIVYTIKELRNKKLVLFRKSNFAGDSFMEEFTFEQ